ncbi:hypothetical protein P3S67_015482 [Capsicum chacoense]
MANLSQRLQFSDMSASTSLNPEGPAAQTPQVPPFPTNKALGKRNILSYISPSQRGRKKVVKLTTEDIQIADEQWSKTLIGFGHTNVEYG